MYVLSSSSSGLLIRVIFDLFACIENMKLKSILCREKIIKMISLMEFVMTRVIHALTLKCIFGSTLRPKATQKTT